MGVFQDIKYYLANSLPPHRQEQLEYALSKNGARKADITTATHIITNSPHFEGCEDVKDGPAIVSDYWVDRSLVLGKMQPSQYYSVDPAMVFSGIVACASDLPTADLEVLSAGISALGGQWRSGLTNDVTHLFAIRPDSQKYKTALAHRESTGIKIILPHWFDDSVRLGLRDLPVHTYAWPDPPYLKEIGISDINTLGPVKEEDKAKKIMMVTANLFTPTADSKVPVPRDVDLMPVKKGVWNGKRILLSWTLALYSSRRQAVEASIRRAGGEILRYPGDDDDDVSTEEKEKRRDKKESRAVVECDILITRWRYGKAYGKAFRLHKTIGTLAWLYHVQSTGTTPRPVDQLLHYPIPRKPIEGFNLHEITVTNYTGEAREYIKRLITAMGATFTPSMTGRNTVLIAAYTMGIKADKARAWSLPVVNHTWLEDCFIQWRLLTPATEKYIIFPPGVDFSKLLGERGVGVRGVELCEEEEGRGGDGGDHTSEDEDASGIKVGVDAKLEHHHHHHDDDDDDKVLAKKDEDEDIDMISMPDTDGPAPYDTSPPLDNIPNSSSPKKKRNGKEKSAREISESVSPVKRAGRDSSVQQVSPSKKRGMLSANGTPGRPGRGSPVKQRRLVDDGGDDGGDDQSGARMDVDPKAREAGNEKGASATRKKAVRERDITPVPMDVDEAEDERTPITPLMKSKRKDVMSSVKERKTGSFPDLELSDHDELDQTPGFYKPSSSRSKGPKAAPRNTEGSEEEEEVVEERRGDEKKSQEKGSNSEGHQNDASPKKSSTRKSTSNKRSTEEEEEEEEEEVKTPPPGKKRLVRRLNSEESLQLAREKEREKDKQAEASSSSRKLVRRASGKVAQDTDGDEEKKDSGDEKENVTVELVDVPKKVGLLKTARGDARTRVKAKSAKAKARELYSDSEDEVVGIVETKKGKGKAKGKAIAGTKGKQKRKVRRETPEEEMLPESEEEDEEPADQRKQVPTKQPTSVPATKENAIHRTPLRQQVSVVVNPPPSVRALSTKAKRNANAKVVDVDSYLPSDDEGETSPEPTFSTHQVKKTESILVEAREKAFVRSTRSKPISSPAGPTSKSGQAPASSPLSVIQTPNTDTSELLPARRGAATRAEQKLKVMMPDVSKFELEMRKARKSGGSGLRGIEVGSWDRGDTVKVNTRNKKKRNSDEVDVKDEAEEGGERKKRRRSSGKVHLVSEEETDEPVISVPVSKGKGKRRESDQGIIPGNIYVMTTQVTLSDSVIKSLEKLGVAMTIKPSQCTHLIASHLVRTEKFLCALSNAPFILDSAWAMKSATAKQLQPEDEFLLSDPAAESKYDLRLKEALARARELRGKLFAQKTFYVTLRTKVDFKLLKSVVTAHGGQLLHQSPTLRMLHGNPDRHVISCPQDVSVWRPLAAEGIPIYTHEFLLIGVLKQELEWDKADFRVEGSL